jgi:DNA-binding response OmpR family regulator
MPLSRHPAASVRFRTFGSFNICPKGASAGPQFRRDGIHAFIGGWPMNEVELELDSQLLRGKRIFVVEEDDVLYCQIKNSLQAVGGAVFGALAHFPDMPIDIPAIRFDVALVDVDGESPSLSDVVDELRYREIPMILLSAYDIDDIARQLGGYQQLRKPYAHREAIARIAALCSALSNRPATLERDRRGGKKAMHTPASAAPKSHSAPARVLVVEDEQLICLFLQECLQSAGYNVQLLCEGKAALEVAGEGSFDAAIIDVGLPDVSGDEIARRLHDRDPSLPIILTSGFDCHPLAEQFGEDRRVRVLAKPFDETTVLRTLQEFRPGAPPASSLLR